MKNFDHVLMIGFGGPEKPEDVLPFLKEVTRGIPIPEERLKEVAHHYELLGGKSPYNEYAKRIQAALSKEVSLPLFLGMKNWHPFMKDVMSGIKSKGYKKGIGLILATQRSDASYEKYIRCVEEAKAACGAESIAYIYLPSWFEHPLFIGAQADQVRKVISKTSPGTALLFTAHSIPAEMAQKSRYAQEFERGAELVARELGFTAWFTAYQSRSGSPRQPWLEPDVLGKLEEIAKSGIKKVVVVPIGFVTDNVEVLYDLDIEVRDKAKTLGVEYLRASSVMDHPKFIQLLAELIREAGK